MTAWRVRTIQVELEFLAGGTVSDGTAVDLITAAVETIGELSIPDDALPGTAKLRVKPPRIRSVKITGNQP